MFMRIYKILKELPILLPMMTRGNVGAPILVSRDGVVLDGNSRLRVAKRLGFKKIPVVIIDSDVRQVDPSDLTEGY